MNFASAAIEVLSALTTAANLFIIAAGLSLVFGALRIINLAHGSFYMIGALLMASLLAPGRSALLFWPALLLSPLLMAGLGALLERFLFRRIYRAEHLMQLLLSYALSLMLADLALRLWGADSRTVPPPPLLAGAVGAGGVSFPLYDLFVIGLALAVGCALWALLRYTRFGWEIRAAVEDPESLALCGRNVPALFTAVFALGAFLAGLGGAAIAPLQAIGPGMDSAILVSAFIVTVIGGLGSIAGAALGAAVIGLFQAVGTVWLPTWAPAFIFLAMIIVLVFRPSGLLGAPTQSWGEET
jgi:branched-chain amino acid transport system permease protein